MKKRENFDKEMRKHWYNRVTNDWVEDVMNRRGEKVSCVHDLARILTPQGKISDELINVLCLRAL